MTDKEKVIKGLHQHCECSLFDRCGECPYYVISDEQFSCRDRLLEDVLFLLKEHDTQVQYRDDHIAEHEKEIKKLNKLLKEQEAVKPIAKENDTYECVYGAIVGWDELDASGIVQTRLNYCPFCGQAVRWE